MITIRRFSSVAVAYLLSATLTFTYADPAQPSKWITSWTTSQQPNVTQQTISNATVRMIARIKADGTAVRIRLDNTFAASPVQIGHAFVGARVQNALLAAGSNRQVRFSGSPSVVIPAGGSVMSDPVEMRVFAHQDLAVSLYMPQAGVNPSMHQGAVVTSYRTADNTGDQSASEAASAFTLTTTQMWWLKAVDVYSTNTVGTVVGFADSITDGTCTTLDAHNRWEDHVSMRMDVGDNSFRVAFGAAPLIRAPGLRTGGTESIALHKAVVNEGIGGNTVTRDNLQPPPDSIPGIERLDRDVLSHSGVTHVVLFMGTNDIRREASAAQVIAGMQNIIDRVRARGIKIIGATIIPRHNVPPSGTNTGWNDAKTAIRNQVNAWIRTQAPFDGVIDFDAVVRDPANHDLIYPAFNCGDGIHPSPAGYYQMGKAVDLDLFGTRDRN